MPAMVSMSRTRFHARARVTTSISYSSSHVTIRMASAPASMPVFQGMHIPKGGGEVNRIRPYEPCVERAAGAPPPSRTGAAGLSVAGFEGPAPETSPKNRARIPG